MDQRDLQSKKFNSTSSFNQCRDTKTYYQNEPRFNGVYSWDNLPDKIKDGAYVINLDEYFNIGTPWITLYALNNSVSYSGSFCLEHIPKEVKKFIDISLIIANIYRIQAYDLVMGGYFCTGLLMVKA